MTWTSPPCLPASQTHPEPNCLVPASLNLAWKSLKSPKVLVMAWAMGPVGSPPSLGFMIFQNMAINGSGDGGAGSGAYYLDGGANMTGLRNTGNATPNPDAIQEFRVITNGYGAEFGRFTSGVVDVVTKSGTNRFHGSLFEFLRNDTMNAKGWNNLD